MRLKVVLSPSQDTPQPLPVHHLQGALYSIFKHIGYSHIHTEARYKFFCYTSFFPFEKNQPYKKDIPLTWMISSPRDDLISALHGFFSFKPELSVGAYPFRVQSSQPFHKRVIPDATLITSTPIVCSIPQKLYPTYHIESTRTYSEWTSKQPLNAFIDLTTHNLVRKYNRYFDAHIPEDTILFHRFTYKQFAVVPYKNAKIYGSYWEFPLDHLEPATIPIIQFGLDCGFGEKNSAGFGFMNIKNNT